MPNADGTPTPDEQAAVEANMKAPKEPVSADAKDAMDERYAELQATLTDERAKREAAERSAQEANAKLLAAQSGAAPRSARQLPLWYVIQDKHAAASGDVQAVVDDINKDLADVPGFKTLTLADFLAYNTELLDADAKARGFDRGARWSATADDGSAASGYHLFAGASVLAGVRDASAAKPKSGNVNATVTTGK